MKIVFYNHKEIQIIDFETTKLACPWILGNLIVFQFFLLLLIFTKKSRKNKDHLRTTSTQNLPKNKVHYLVLENLHWSL